MNSELKGIYFPTTLDEGVVVKHVRRLIADYITRWLEPIAEHTFSKQVEGEHPDGPWLGTIDDFCDRMKIALSGGLGGGLCQCQWQIRDASINQYWWIRFYFTPIPHLQFASNALKGNITKNAIRFQESALTGMVNEKIFDLAITKSAYIGRISIIYLYFKLANCGMITPSIYLKKASLEPGALLNAIKSVDLLLAERNISKTVSVRYSSVLESIKDVDDILKSNPDSCKYLIESLGCSNGEWFK